MSEVVEQALEQAAALAGEGQYAKARRHLARLSNTSQRDARVQQQLGHWFDDMNDSVAAAFCFDRWVRADSASADALVCLGRAVHQNNALEQAAASFEAALRIAPDRADAWASLGDVYFAQGHVDRAKHAYERARVADPECAEALAGLAAILAQRGDDTVALKLLNGSTPVSDNADLALLHARLLGRDGDAGAAEQRLRSATKAADVTRQQRARLDFALGDALDAQGRSDEAFAAYLRGNATRSAGYDVDYHRGLVAFVAYRSSARRTVKARPHATAPLFIVGMPRSGMALLARLLARHPLIGSPRPQVALCDVVAQLAERGKRYAYPEDPAAMTSSALERAAERYRGNWQGIGGDMRYVCDTTPGNWLYLDMMARLFPKARVINVRRNAHDLCWSLFSNDFAEPPLPFANSLEHIGERFVDYHQLMEVWRASPPLPLMDVDYEALASEPAQTLTKVLEFLAIEASAAPLLDGLRQPLHEASIGRAEPYRDYLGPIDKALREGGVDA